MLSRRICVFRRQARWLWFKRCRVHRDCCGPALPILIATKPVDFQCGHNALALIVQAVLKLDPHSSNTVLFSYSPGDRFKISIWDGTGLVLTCKILDLRKHCMAEGRGRGGAVVLGASGSFIRWFSQQTLDRTGATRTTPCHGRYRCLSRAEGR